MTPGDLLELRTGSVAHGGHVVARHDGHVVFVRHALPGELVRVAITEDSGRFLRGDAVEVLEASPHRVTPPCPLAHADGCGGCDFQHVDLGQQRHLKAMVVEEQLKRLAKIERDVVCEAVPGDTTGLRWRTRMQYVELPDGGHGLRKHRSHDVVRVDDCLIARADAREPEPGTTRERVTVGSRTHEFAVASDGFWQVHKGAPALLVETVLAQLQPREGERALDLYAGVGLFGAFIGDAVGAAGDVIAVESDKTAADHATANLALASARTRVYAEKVDRWLARSRKGVDLVVLDPPRTGAKRAVVESIAALTPRAIAYVACDPAALARDLAYFAECGYVLGELRCLDLFPMTHHVECVAQLVPQHVS